MSSHTECAIFNWVFHICVCRGGGLFISHFKEKPINFKMVKYIAKNEIYTFIHLICLSCILKMLIVYSENVLRVLEIVLFRKKCLSRTQKHTHRFYVKCSSHT